MTDSDRNPLFRSSRHKPLEDSRSPSYSRSKRSPDNRSKYSNRTGTRRSGSRSPTAARQGGSISTIKYASSLAAELSKHKKARERLENRQKQKAQVSAAGPGPTVIEIDDDLDDDDRASSTLGSMPGSRTESPAPIKQVTPKFQEGSLGMPDKAELSHQVYLKQSAEEEREEERMMEAQPVPFQPVAAQPLSLLCTPPPRRSIAHLPLPPPGPDDDNSMDTNRSPCP